MTTKNGDMPAMPITSEQAQDADTWGMSKREMFCLHTGVAETGDAELDEIIRKGNRQKIAAQICNGFICGDFDLAGPRFRLTELASESVATADALLAELERTK